MRSLSVDNFCFLEIGGIKDFSIPSVLWGIDGDWMTSFMPEIVEFYPTDHCGVLRCKTEAVNPRYLAHILEREGKQMGFSWSYRVSIDRIEGITFTVADRKTQDDTVAEIATIETQIMAAESTLASLNGKIADVLNRCLIIMRDRHSQESNSMGVLIALCASRNHSFAESRSTKNKPRKGQRYIMEYS